MNDQVPASVLSTQFFQKIASGDQKGAADAATDYTRITVRDESLVRQILPPKSITEADCDTQLDTDMPVKIVEKEVRQPLGRSISYGELPTRTELNFSKYRVDFARLATEAFVKDIAQVKTWEADIRNIFKDNAIQDLLTTEDVPFFSEVDKIVSSTGVGSTAVGNTASSLTGKVQYYNFANSGQNPLGTTGFKRETTIEALKILSKGYGDATISTPIRSHVDCVVMNVNTGLEYTKWDHDQIGGPLSEQLFKDGLTIKTLHGKKHIFTLKDDIVADGVAYYFAKPDFLGRFYELQAPTMFLELRAYMLEFFVYSCIGCTIGNPYAVAKAKFF